MSHDTEGSEPAILAPDQTSAMREMLRIAIPAVITMLSYTAMQFVDLLVTSRLGSDALAAVGNGGVAAFLPASIIFGITGVIATYVSQHLGAGNPERGSAYAWNGLWMCAAVGVMVLLPLSFFLENFFAIMRGLFALEAPPGVVVLEVEYGRIVMAWMGVTICARGISHFFYGVHRARIVMIAALICNAINIPLTIGLVFGKWGLPELGVKGAAIATVIGSIVELAILFFAFISPRFDGPFKTRRAWRPSWGPVRDILKIGWPAGLTFGSEMTCWWVFMTGLIAHFGVDHNAAGWIVLRYMQISFMPAFGLSMAVTAVVGKCIGMGRHDLAAQRAWLGLRMCMVYMACCALAMILFRHQAVAIFGSQHGTPVTSDALTIAANLLIVAAVFQVFDSTAIIMLAALRGAGDTVWPGLVTFILSWLLIIGAGKLLIEVVPEWGSLGPWLAAASYVIVLAVFLIVRFIRGGWRRIDLLGRPGISGFPEPRLAMGAGEGIAPEMTGTDVDVLAEPTLDPDETAGHTPV